MELLSYVKDVWTVDLPTAVARGEACEEVCPKAAIIFGAILPFMAAAVRARDTMLFRASLVSMELDLAIWGVAYQLKESYEERYQELISRMRQQAEAIADDQAKVVMRGDPKATRGEECVDGPPHYEPAFWESWHQVQYLTRYLDPDSLANLAQANSQLREMVPGRFTSFALVNDYFPDLRELPRFQIDILSQDEYWREVGQAVKEEGGLTRLRRVKELDWKKVFEYCMQSQFAERVFLVQDAVTGQRNRVIFRGKATLKKLVDAIKPAIGAPGDAKIALLIDGKTLMPHDLIGQRWLEVRERIQAFVV